MSSILYGMIHQRAMDSYSGPDINAANYQLWTDHWFKTAEKIMESLQEKIYWLLLKQSG